MDILYRLGEASAAQVLVGLPDPPSYGAVRTTLRILEHKGHVTHDRVDRRFYYTPVQQANAVRLARLHHVIKTFFRSSTVETIEVLLENPFKPFSEFELRRLEGRIQSCRQRDGR